jgi:hypothetical protein
MGAIMEHPQDRNCRDQFGLKKKPAVLAVPSKAAWRVSVGDYRRGGGRAPIRIQTKGRPEVYCGALYGGRSFRRPA